MRHCSGEESYVGIMFILYRRITAILMLRLKNNNFILSHSYKRLLITASFPLHSYKNLGIFFYHLYFFMSVRVGLTYFKQKDIISTLITLVILIMHTASTGFVIPPCISLCLDCVEFNGCARMNRKAEPKRETRTKSSGFK